jgi:predicted enzyme related to lactoylglutathione lyase
VATVSFRYIVSDMDAAVAFYAERLGFTVTMRPAPAFAMLERGDLRLLLSVPGGGPGGGAPMPSGALPEPGGWNRMVLEVDDLDAVAAELAAGGATFRNPIVEGMGGRQTLVEDPSGNPIELFQPTRDEARLSR